MEECKKCGPECKCGPNCTCPPGCKGNCGPKMCPPKPCFPCVARVLEPAPCFEGQVWYDGMIQNIKLSDYKDKWVVLFFYPFDFTFVCPTEICAFSDASDNFAKINCQLIGASCDSIFVHREFALRERKQGGVAPLKIPLLADNSHEIAKKYGCYIYKLNLFKKWKNAKNVDQAANVAQTVNVLLNAKVNVDQKCALQNHASHVLPEF